MTRGTNKAEDRRDEADRAMQPRDEQTKTVAPKIDVENIPDELKQQRRWVGWRYQQRDGKATKLPVSCMTGQPADVTDPRNWSTFGAALTSVNGRELDGIGFAFGQDGPYAGVDLDNCRMPESGKLAAWAGSVVRLLNSYTEVSPSGRGLHVFVKGRLPAGGGHKRGNVEFYDQDRFFTVTGRRLEGTPKTVVDRQEELTKLHGQVFDSDETIVTRAGQAADGGKFRKLWEGDDSGYDSPSEADQALCGILAYWTYGNSKRMEVLFGQSGLAKRKKWERREDYRKTTIETAVMGQLAEVFTRGTKRRQEKTEYTEKTRNKHVAVPAEDRQGKAVQMAIDLATTEGKASDWIASFKLARRLRKLSSDDPEQFESAVDAFCDKAGRKFEPLWYAFLDCWDSVRHAEGEGEMKWAAKRADEDPYPLSYYPGSKCDQYKKLASMAYYLSRLTAPKPFWLTRELVAPLIGCNHPAEVTRIINRLVKKGVIKCVNDSYRYAGPNPKAKEYEFIGGPHNE